MTQLSQARRASAAAEPQNGRSPNLAPSHSIQGDPKAACPALETRRSESEGLPMVVTFTIHETLSPYSIKLAPHSQVQMHLQTPNSLRSRGEAHMPCGSTRTITVYKPNIDFKFGIVMTSFHGVLTVRSLANESALLREGLAVGDRILQINNRRPNGAEHACQMIAGAFGKLVFLVQSPSQSSTRIGETKEVLLPKAAAANSGEAITSSGVTFRQQSGLRGQLLIESISERVAGLNLGLRTGEAIFSVNGVPLLNPAQAEAAWRAAPAGLVRLMVASDPYTE